MFHHQDSFSLIISGSLQGERGEGQPGPRGPPGPPGPPGPGSGDRPVSPRFLFHSVFHLSCDVLLYDISVTCSCLSTDVC